MEIILCFVTALYIFIPLLFLADCINLHKYYFVLLPLGLKLLLLMYIMYIQYSIKRD